jgi:hypothetical protein
MMGFKNHAEMEDRGTAEYAIYAKPDSFSRISRISRFSMSFRRGFGRHGQFDRVNYLAR